MTQILRTRAFTSGLFAAAVLFAGTVSSQAALIYHVTVSSAALTTTSNINTYAPFSLDFQLNDGGILGNNTVSLSNFSFTGGSASGNLMTYGGATGNLTSGITLNDTAAFNELIQDFAPGTSFSFDISLTNATDGINPDAFVFAIYDKTDFITTTGPSNSLIVASIKGDPFQPDIKTGAGTGDFTGVTVNVTSVPEPSAGLFSLLGLGLFGFFRTSRRQLQKVS